MKLLSKLHRILFTGWRPCHKEQLGYRCRHQVREDGSKECD